MKLVPAPSWPRPSTEWPSVLLFVGIMSTFAASTTMALHFPHVVWPIFMIVNAFCVYAGFTIVHDACHKNISRRFPKTEFFMGTVCGLMMHGSFYQFIPIHLQHHAKVNVPDEDPDFHARGPRTPLRIFLWASTLAVYFWQYFRLHLNRGQNMVFVFFPYLILWTIYGAAYKFGFLFELLMMWSIPSLIGLVVTVYIFDHLPHHPHQDAGKYTNARIYPLGWGDWFFGMQSFHLGHHLWPSIPWYRYRECYYQRRLELLEQGTVETKLSI